MQWWKWAFALGKSISDGYAHIYLSRYDRILRQCGVCPMKQGRPSPIRVKGQ